MSTRCDGGPGGPALETTGDYALSTVLRLADDLAAGRSQDGDATVLAVLRGLRGHLGMDVCFVGEFLGGYRVVRAVDEALDSQLLPPGTRDPLEASFCGRVADGRLPEVVPDAALEPALADLSVVRTMPVGAHLSVPIRASDGSVQGTLCGFSHAPDPSLSQDALGVMRLLATLLGRHLERGRVPDDVRQGTRRRVEQVIAEEHLSMVFQPVLDLGTGTVVGYEALSRFHDGESAALWFARAATVELGTELELAAVTAALAHLETVPADRYLAVNLSAAALCSPGLPDVLNGHELSRVVVELTEQTGVPDADVLDQVLVDLRGEGARVAVDDAGAGYAGLQRILQVSPELIKLDRALVHALDVDHPRRSMVQALTWFADSTGAQLVAEGIETAPELDTLRHLGVRLGQGYHLGRPGPLP